MEKLPDTSDYYMKVVGINEEAMYHVVNSHTGVYECISRRFYFAFDEMLSLQLAYDDIQELLSGEYDLVIEFTPEGIDGIDGIDGGDDDDDGGVVH